MHHSSGSGTAEEAEKGSGVGPWSPAQRGAHAYSSWGPPRPRLATTSIAARGWPPKRPAGGTAAQHLPLGAHVLERGSSPRHVPVWQHMTSTTVQCRCADRKCGEIGMEEIFRAAREGNEGEVIRLLDTDPTLLEQRVDDYGNRPLIVAAKHGQLGVVRLLIQRSADINATGYWNRMALHWAAQGGHEEVVACLIQHGAQAAHRDVNGVTPLVLAACNGRLGIVMMLVQHMGGQVFDERAPNGWTALHGAALSGREEVVRFLLLAGADPTIANNQGLTPRALAEEHYPDEQNRQRRARCVAVFQWWEGELKRRAVLCRATCLHKAYTTQRDQPTSQVPTYLEARVAAGHAVPVVEVVSLHLEQPQQQQQQETADGLGKRKAAGERGDAQGAEAGEEETRHAVVEYVLKGLNEELLTELLEGFHCGK